MNTIQRIIKNIGVLLLSQFLSYFLGFFTLTFTVRYLGVEGFGMLSLALAFTGIFSVCMDLGLSTLAIREIARDKTIAKDYIANIVSIKILLAFVTFFMIIIIVNILGYNSETIEVIYLIGVYTVFSAFSQLFYAVFQANEKMEYNSLGSILSSFLMFGGVLLAIPYRFDIIQFASIYTIVGLITLCFSIFLVSLKFFLPEIKLDFIKWKMLIKESWPFAFTGISINLYLWVDSIILSVIQGSAAVGIYNASYKLTLLLLFIPVVFNNALFPLMSKYYISSEQSLKFTFEKLFKIMMLVAIPIGVGTVVIANKVILLVYGTQFMDSVIVLQILIWSTVLIFARNPFETLMDSSNRQLLVTKIFILGVIFNIILNLIFIPKYSYIGAGIITVLTDALVLGLMVITFRDIGVSISNKIKGDILKGVLASLVMGIIIFTISYLDIFVLILIAILIYITLILVLKTFDEDEIIILKSILRRN